MKKFFRSFKYAIEGLKTAFKEEFNFRFHLTATVIVLVFGLLFKLTVIEWILILICIGVVLSVELINTAIENICDHFSIDEDPTIKKVKDISAAAVLVVSIMSAIIGIFIFYPYLAHFINP